MDVLADDAEFAHEIDVPAAEQARADVQARIERDHDERAQADLKKAEVRLSISA